MSRRHLPLAAFALAAALPAAASAQGMFVTEPVFLAHCSARLTVKAERTPDPAAAAALRESAKAALARASRVPDPEHHGPARLEGYAAEMAKFLRERLATHADMAAELERSVAQCRERLAEPR